MQLVKINPNMSIENAFRRSDSMLILVQFSDKMAVISQTIYSDAFPWMKSFQFCLKFHWSLFLYTKGPGDYSWE